MIENRPQYPFRPEGAKKHGFPFWEIISRPEESFSVTAASGIRLEVTKTSNMIELKDMKHVPTRMRADVDNGVATFEVFTEKKRFLGLLKWKQPDFFAGKFVECALYYFRKKNIDVHTCRGNWFSDSVNGKEFFDNLENKKMNPAEAAKNTWSGRKFMELGFTGIENADVNIIDLGDNSLIFASFRLPSPSR